MTEKEVPAVAVVGTTVIASLVAELVMLKLALVAEVRTPDVAVSLYPVPTLLMLSPVNEATPEVAALVTVPARVPAPGFVLIARVMLAVDVVTVLPRES